MIQNIKRGIAMLSVASAINLSAQTTYKARVINQDTGEPIIGAVVKGNKGVEAVTNEDGYFSLNTNDDQTLHISYIGFKEQDIKAQALKDNLLSVLFLVSTFRRYRLQPVSPVHVVRKHLEVRLTMSTLKI